MTKEEFACRFKKLILHFPHYDEIRAFESRESIAVNLRAKLCQQTNPKHSVNLGGIPSALYLRIYRAFVGRRLVERFDSL